MRLGEDRERQQAAVQERLPLEVTPRNRRGLVAVVEGFSLHAGTWVHGHDRQGLERLVRFGARAPVAESTLTRLEDASTMAATDFTQRATGSRRC